MKISEKREPRRSAGVLVLVVTHCQRVTKWRRRASAAADDYGWNVTDLYDEVEAVYITSGKLSLDAAAYADSTKSSHGISCSVMDRAKLLEFLETCGQSRLVKIIEKYY